MIMANTHGNKHWTHIPGSSLYLVVSLIADDNKASFRSSYLGIFSTREKAEEFMENLSRLSSPPKGCEIEVRYLDDPDFNLDYILEYQRANKS